nr:vacuolar protein sorting-associated protein 9 [Cryptococcus depauperatus CBS 7841]
MSSPSKNLPLTTPAPSRPSTVTLTAPDAPAHAPPAKGLPTATPASSVTPSAGRQGQIHDRAIDLAEFDPYATPASAPMLAIQEQPEQAEEKEEAKVTVQSTAMTPSNSSQGHERRENGIVSDVRSQTQEQEGQQEQLGEQEVRNKEAVFNFSEFLKDLKQKSAEPVAKYLKSFLLNFVKKPFTVNEQIKLINDFLDFIADKMTQVEPWKSQSPAEFDNALEAMEKLVMNRLYNYTFTPQLVPSQPITTDDLERDAVLSQRVRLFGWIREKHLDVPESEAAQGFLGFAEQELSKINHYKAPRDKMICLLNCCKVIYAGLIRNTYGASGGADAFIPILIFVVLRANPENLISNLEYIQRFRSASRLEGEAAYYLSSLAGSIQFIETMDASSLSNITQEEFETFVENAIQELPPSPTNEKRRFTDQQQPPYTPSGGKDERRLRDAGISPFAAASPGEEAARPLSMTGAQASLEGTRRWFARTGNLAQEAVSRPLSAIGKIIENMGPGEGHGPDGGGGYGSESEAHRGLVIAQAGVQQGGTATPRDVFGVRRFRAATPESPSRATHLIADDFGPSRAQVFLGTPSSDILPEFSDMQLQNTIEHSQETFDQTRRANVQTLHQMFPNLDEDLVGDVLEGCGDDLGVAIDRLLEM